MANDGIGGSVDDQGLQTKLGCVVMPYQEMSLVSGASLGNGVPVVAANGVAASEQAGLAMTTDDEAYGRLDLRGKPWWRDPERDILAEILYGIEEASKSNIDWGLWVKGVAVGEASSDAKVSADSNLVFPAISNTAAGEVGNTARLGLGLLQGVDNELKDDDHAEICVELLDVGDATAEKVFLLAVRFWFTVQFSHASGVRQLT